MRLRTLLLLLPMVAVTRTGSAQQPAAPAQPPGVELANIKSPDVVRTPGDVPHRGAESVIGLGDLRVSDAGGSRKAGAADCRPRPAPGHRPGHEPGP